jgi:hypothetical protein
MTDEDMKVIECMETMGGGFFQALAAAARRADATNLKKIKEAWEADWERYRKLGARFQ